MWTAYDQIDQGEQNKTKYDRMAAMVSLNVSVKSLAFKGKWLQVSWLVQFPWLNLNHD